MREWHTTYLSFYVDDIGTIAEIDPGLAEEVLLAIWGFHDDSEAVTPLLSGVVSLTSTRRQDIEHLKMMIGHRFPAYLAVVGLRRAVRVLAAVTTFEDPYGLPSEPVYSITIGTVSGQVDTAARSLSRPGTRTSAQVLDAFAAAMRTAELSTQDAEGLAADVVASTRHPQVWRRLLLTAADKPAVLGRAFVPALLAGGLFLHHETRAAACALVTAAVPHLSDTEFSELEAGGQLTSFLDAEPASAVLGADEIEIIEPPLNLNLLRDYLGNTHDDLDPEVLRVLASLRQAIDAAKSSEGDSVGIVELERAFRHAVDATVALFADAPDHPARELVFWAAEELFAKRHPGPGTPLGELLVGMFLAAETEEQG